jgi:hypothetical protein
VVQTVVPRHGGDDDGGGGSSVVSVMEDECGPDSGSRARQ